MKYSKKIREKAIEGVKKLISEGNDKEAVLISISELTGVPKDVLDGWVSQNEANLQNYLKIAPPKKVDKLAGYRDKRMNSKRHPDDIKVEELQEQYLADTYGF